MTDGQEGKTEEEGGKGETKTKLSEVKREKIDKM